MDVMANKVETQTHRRVTIRSAAILLYLSLIIVLGVATAKRMMPSKNDSGTTVSSVQPASCRLVLASPMAIDTPIDREIKRQQALIINDGSSDGAFERLGWLFVKQARLS